MTEGSGLISVDEALDRILRAMPRLGTETVSLSDASGRWLANDITARRTQPPFAISAMDGYALRSQDASKAPFTLTRIGEVAAGGAFEGTVGTGQVVRIFTGGRVPHGADCVIMQEMTSVDGDLVTFSESKPAGNNIRRAGADFTEGDKVLAAGQCLTPAAVALLAAVNVPWIEVARKPRIAILATGDELARPGELLGPNQIVSSNNFGLAAMVSAWGGIPVDLGIARDNEEDLRTRIEGARHADMLVTIGGASVGDHDLVQKVLRDEGMELDFWRIAMKPGKPLIFGSWSGSPMVGLPGNPVSALVCARLYLKAALAAMQGACDPLDANRPLAARLGKDLPANTVRQDYIRTRVEDLDGVRTAMPFDSQDSGQLLILASADGLIIRKPHAPAAQKGDEVLVLPL